MRFHMLFGSTLGMIPGMKIMRVSQMCMVRSLVMIAGFMMLRGFGVMMCSHPVMMSRLLVMMRRFLRHREISIPLADSEHGWILPYQSFPMGYDPFNSR